MLCTLITSKLVELDAKHVLKEKGAIINHVYTLNTFFWMDESLRVVREGVV